ncbi:MAG: hypothetical protein ACOC1L_06445 [Bacillota bacterium]
MITINNFKNVLITNSTFYHNQADSFIEVNNFNEDSNVKIINSIIDVDHLQKQGNVNNNLINTTLNSVVLTNTLENFLDPTTYYLAVDNVDSINIQDDWTSTLDGKNALNSTEINYLTSAYDTITLNGNDNYPTSGYEFHNGQRDGVGALYFPEVDTTLSSNDTSGNVPFSIDFSIPSTDSNLSANSITFHFGDGDTLSTSNISATHEYDEIGTYEAYVEIESKNLWYTSEGSPVSITAFESDISSTFDIYDKETSAIVTSANTYQDLFVSGDTISGTLSKYKLDFGDGNSETINNDEIYYEFFYTTSGDYTVELTSYNSLDQSSTTSSDIDISNRVTNTYYVDISEEYESSESGDGTEADPFNWSEFISAIGYDGVGNFQDTFKLKGYRKIVRPDGNSKNPYSPFEIDKSKHFIIEDWDNDTNGPWMIVSKDFDNTGNIILDFENCTLKNGIIYNQPLVSDDLNYGGKITVSNLYNMFIVVQGSGSQLEFAAVNDLQSIFGSTIYSENGMININKEDSDLKIYDSIITNLNPIDTSFDDVDLYSYYTAYNKSQSNFLSDFTVSADVDNQFEWDAPDDYYFTVDNKLYDKDLEWLNNNKRELRPFTGIERPPNPGVGYPTYSEYDEGLFGESRENYEAS